MNIENEKNVIRAWWAQNDPRKSAMYRWFWRLFAFMSISFALTLLYSGASPQSIHQNVSRELLVLWLLFFASQLIISTRAQQIVRLRNGQNTITEEERSQLKLVNRFPGWIMVLFVWAIGWLNALLLVYDKWLLGYRVEFHERYWYPLLLVVTGVFNISDLARQALADEAENSYKKVVTAIFKTLFAGMLKRIEREKLLSDAK